MGLTQTSSHSTSKVDIAVRLDAPAWHALRDVIPLATQAAQAAIIVADAAPQGEIGICLSDDAAVQTLNKRYRNKNKPTNVLAFPPAKLQPAGAPMLLGDVIIAFETAQMEADAAKKSLCVHVRHLIIHGVLHLLGYDHQTNAEAKMMEALEQHALAHVL